MNQLFQMILRGVLLKVQVQKAMTEESLVGPEYSLWYTMIVGVLFQPTDVRYACSDILTPFVCW